MRAILAGAVLGGITLFRPGDVLPVALASSLVMLPVLLRQPLGRAVGIVLCALAGAGAVAGVAAALISATTGFGPGSYFALSANIGFEFRLLPLRFVTLVLDGRPLLDGVATERLEPGLHRGLAEVFLWVIPGIAGAVACCAARGARPVHALLAMWMATHLALLLCYRDLHTSGFWLYGNYHYFKAVQPVLLLFAIALTVGVMDRSLGWRGMGAALAAVGLVFVWRAELVPGPAVVSAPMAEGVAVGAVGTLESAVILPATGRWNAIYSGAHTLTIGGAVFYHNYDFKLYARRDDMLLIPIRKLPPGPAVLTLGTGVTLGAGPVLSARQTIVFGLPCAFGLAGAATCGGLGAPLIAGQ